MPPSVGGREREREGGDVKCQQRFDEKKKYTILDKKEKRKIFHQKSIAQIKKKGGI